MKTLISILQLFEAKPVNVLRQTPTLVKHCTVAVLKNPKFKGKYGTSRKFGAFNLCRHVMSSPYHKGTKDGKPPFYKKGAATVPVNKMQRTNRGVRRDFKHSFEKGGGEKSSAFHRQMRYIEKEYFKDLANVETEKRLRKNRKKEKTTKQGKKVRRR